jgi:hypothetical protein
MLSTPRPAIAPAHDRSADFAAAVGLFVVGVLAAFAVGNTSAPIWLSAAFTLLMSALLYRCARRSAGAGVIAITPVFCLLVIYVLASSWRAAIESKRVSLAAPAYHSEELYALVNHHTCLGIACFSIGWWLYSMTRSALRRAPSVVRMFSVCDTTRTFAVTLCCCIAGLVLNARTETILTAGYGDRSLASIGSALEINVIKPSLYLCTMLLATCYLRHRRRLWGWIVAGVSGLGIGIFGLLSGNRVEESGAFLALGFLWVTFRPRRRTYWRIATSALVLYAVYSGVGLLRQSAFRKEETNASLLELGGEVSRQRGLLEGRAMISTGGDAFATATALIGVIESGTWTLDYGTTFVNVLKQTLPKSMSPMRPDALDPELRAVANTNGGCFIINEPYRAFGVAGICGFMLVVGYAFSWAEHWAGRYILGSKQCLIYCAVLLALPRFVMYGFLPLYKTILTCVIIVSCIGAVSARLVTVKHNGAGPLFPLPHAA